MNNTSVTLHISTEAAISYAVLDHRLRPGLCQTRCSCGVRVVRRRDPETGELMGYDTSHAEHVADEVRKRLCLSDVLMVKPGEKVGMSIEEYQSATSVVAARDA